MQHIETAAVAAVAIAQKRKVSLAKARDLEIPNRRAFQAIGERRAGIRLERHRVRTDLNRCPFRPRRRVPRCRAGWPSLIARRGSSKRTKAVIGTFAVGGIQRFAVLSA